MFRLEFDGVSRGNPGHSGAAAYLFRTESGYEECIWFDSEYLGDSTTSNQAEYEALILGLEGCAMRQVANLEICGDSELVINQMQGIAKVNNKKLKPLHKKAINLIASLSCVPTYRWIPREQNATADKLANFVVDRELNGEEDEEEEENDLEKEMEERGECFGFTRDEFNILLSYGMKPWKADYSECWDFIHAYKSGNEDEDGNPAWSKYLGSSSMWDD